MSNVRRFSFGNFLRQRGDLALQGLAPDGERIGDGLRAFRGVDDEIDLVVLDQVDHVRTALDHFVHAVAIDPLFVEKLCRTVRGDQLVTAPDQFTCDGDQHLLVRIPYTQECLARFRQTVLGAHHGLGAGATEAPADTHDFPG